MASTSIHCRCTDNQTCRHCLANAKPYFFTPGPDDRPWLTFQIKGIGFCEKVRAKNSDEARFKIRLKVGDNAIMTSCVVVY